MRVIFKSHTFSILVLFLLITYSRSYPEQGKWKFQFDGYSGLNADQTLVVSKSEYKHSTYKISASCSPRSSDEEFSITFTWYLRKAVCWKEYYEAPPSEISPKILFEELQIVGKSLSNGSSYYFTSSETFPCNEQTFYLSSFDSILISQNEHKLEEQKSLKLSSEDHSVKMRSLELVNSSSDQIFYSVPSDGIYQLVLGASTSGLNLKKSNISYSISLEISVQSNYGFLSAADYPLLVFYSVMCVVYVLFALSWLVVSFLRWKELLRVQYWIGAVIFLGMVEKAVFTAEYDSVNRSGLSVPGLIIFAELVSCAKRTLSRLLVIIVSYGFGIVKPRLGIVLNRVVVVGFIYFILASIEGCFRVLKPRNSSQDYNRHLMFAIVPLALLESGVCWWVFSSLWATTRTLKLRRNIIKLNLYKKFTHTLIFAVLSSVIFMIWSIRYLNYNNCLSDWKQLWVNDAVWHVLFAVILLSIIVLWRPTINNQRFAFSPLLDEGSDVDSDGEDERSLMADVSDTMKLRSSRSSAPPSPKEARPVDDDLRWAEENIPSAAKDTGLPTLDSDEEILISKFEISKMQ